MALRSYIREKKNRALARLKSYKNKLKYFVQKKYDNSSKKLDTAKKNQGKAAKIDNSKETFPTVETLEEQNHDENQDLVIPEGSRVINMSIIKGKVVEKVYMTTDKKTITIKGTNL